MITLGQKLNFSLFWLDLYINVGSTMAVIVVAADVFIVCPIDVGLIAVVVINAPDSVAEGMSGVELNSAEPKSNSSLYFENSSELINKVVDVDD